MRSRIEREKHVVELMIRLYCTSGKAHRKERGGTAGPVLCEECQALLDYAHARLSRCRFGEQKPSCRHCTVHCYKPEMREGIRRVMRWSGPRMLLYHPMIAIRHWLNL
ncbi:MAG: nitrous oxide-stimulated promoter family protein [Bacteroidaceae bacterium]|nr:nitrous oxide-stimulated promoter family protein [Bacteroidaceae bacterium]